MITHLLQILIILFLGSVLQSMLPPPTHGQEAVEHIAKKDTDLVALVAHKAVSNEVLSSREAAEIYRMENNKWDDGTLVIIVDLAVQSSVKSQFHNFINARERELKNVWMRFILSGEGRAPTVARSEEEVVSLVASTEGAIGYVSMAFVTDEVKVLALIEPANL